MISVITPSFRQVAYLHRCAASVADQSGSFSHEHIVQDGGSGADFEKWAAQQSFANAVSEADGGMYDAINRGFRRARGRIVGWLNCDEQYLPGTLAAVAEWFQRHPDQDILFGDTVLIDPEGLPLSYRQALLPSPLHIRRCFLSTYSAATFVRRRVLEDGRFLDTSFKAIADAVWIHNLLTSGYRAGVLNEPLAVFTQTGENLGQSEMGRLEGRRWRAGSRVGRSLASVVHRMRKFSAGCYRRREVTVSLYLGSNQERVERRAVVGERWRTKAVES